MRSGSRTPRRTRTLRALLLSVVGMLGIGMLSGLPGLPGPVPDLPPEQPSADWPTADGVGGAHFSSLLDVTPATLPHLEVAWTYRTGDVDDGKGDHSGTAFEATPIMVDETLYVSTPFSRVHAIGAETGRRLWVFDPVINRTKARQGMTTSRGVAAWLDHDRPASEVCRRRIFLASYDARLFALDGRTGKPCVDFGEQGQIDLGGGVARIDGKRHIYKQTAPPTLVRDVVVVGSSIFDGHYVDSPSGLVRGFDARSGALIWSFEPLSRLPGERIEGDFLPAGGANAWATITADEERDLVFVPTGSASPDHWGGFRPGDNLYANSIVALRGSTGEKVWHFQIVHHDLWDYDLPTPPALITIKRGGVEIPAVAQATKTGHIFLLNRETGEPLFPVVERPVPGSDAPGERASPTQPFPLLPRALVPQGLAPSAAWGLTPFDRAACRSRIESLRSDGVFTPPSVRGSIILPGFLGGMEWGGVAIEPSSGLLLANSNNVPMIATLIPAKDVRLSGIDGGAKSSLARQIPAPYSVKREALLSPLGIPCNAPPWGVLHAVDMTTGLVRWETPLGTVRDITRFPTPMAWGSPNLGGPLVTGGLVFIAASMDRRFRAFELATGKLLWERALPASGQATPLTYRPKQGARQFIVIAAGGHWGMSSTLGDYVVAFALPSPAERAGR